MIGGRPRIAINDGRGFIDFGAVLEARGIPSEITGTDPARRLIRMMKRGMLEEDYIAEHLRWAQTSGKDYRFDTGGLTPMLPLRPCKIICVARNWETHAREGGHELPERPIYFAKTENCAIGPGIPIPLPKNIGRIDHEGELGVIICRNARRVKSAEAAKYILGYTVVNDITARELQHELAQQSWPWYAAKSIDSFAPIGPYIVTKSEAEPLNKKRIRVTVNGEIRQDGNLDDMHWKVPDLIEEITRFITLEPGDLIATGTPSGVGPIKSGDNVEVAIDGIGRLSNPVIEFE